MGLMTFFGRIFGSPEAVNTVVEGVTNGLDALVYTDEEKANDAAEDRKAARGVLIQWFQNTQGQNLARRFLAFVITFTWLFQYFAVMGFNLAAVWVDAPEKFMASATVVGDRADNMTGAMMLILGFYFAAPHLGQIVTGAMNRFGGSTQS